MRRSNDVIATCVGDCVALDVCGHIVLVCARSGWGKTTLVLKYLAGELPVDVMVLQSDDVDFVVVRNGTLLLTAYWFPVEKVFFVNDANGEPEIIRCGGYVEHVEVDAEYVYGDVDDVIGELVKRYCKRS